MNIDLDPSGDFVLDVPSQSGTHPLRFPPTIEGIRTLRDVLRKAKKAKRTPKIGEEASPTQWDVDRWIREDAERKLASLGVDTSKLEFKI